MDINAQILSLSHLSFNEQDILFFIAKISAIATSCNSDSTKEPFIKI